MGYAAKIEGVVVRSNGTSPAEFLRLVTDSDRSCRVSNPADLGRSARVSSPTDPETQQALKKARRIQMRARIRRRNTLWTAGAFGMLAVLGAGALQSEITHANSVKPIRMSVTVGQGDTLWGLAQKYSSSSAYLPDAIEEIAEVNGISSSSRLTAGQRLIVLVTNPNEIKRLSHEKMQIADRPASQTH